MNQKIIDQSASKPKLLPTLEVPTKASMSDRGSKLVKKEKTGLNMAPGADKIQNPSMLIPSHANAKQSATSHTKPKAARSTDKAIVSNKPRILLFHLYGHGTAIRASRVSHQLSVAIAISVATGMA